MCYLDIKLEIDVTFWWIPDSRRSEFSESDLGEFLLYFKSEYYDKKEKSKDVY